MFGDQNLLWSKFVLVKISQGQYFLRGTILVVPIFYEVIQFIDFQWKDWIFSLLKKMSLIKLLEALGSS